MHFKTRYYYLSGIILFAALLTGYHYYAAGDAARQIDEAIREQARTSDGGFTIKYTAIDVHPFSGDIEFRDIDLTQPEYRYRAGLIRFDLTYLDFLTIYFRGTGHGLKKLDRLHMVIIKPAIVSGDPARKFESDLLDLNYEGNLYDMIGHLATGNPLYSTHALSIFSGPLRLENPVSGWGNFTADTLALKTRVPAPTASLFSAGDLQSKAIGIRWEPTDKIQEKYGLFIRGAGYDTGNIPADTLLFQLEPGNDDGTDRMRLDLHTELFHAQATASVRRKPTDYSQSMFDNGVINLVETSERFNNFLRNVEGFLGITLPHSSEEALRFRGPVTDPQFSIGNSKP